jgi:flagellin FlaB
VGDEIDLSAVIVSISNGDYKASLVYGGQNSVVYVNTNGTQDIFSNSWPSISNPTTEFGVIVLQDEDGSMNNTEHPTMNFGDKAIIAVNVGDVFGGITPRERIYGEVIPEFGASGIIEFRAPSTFSEHVVTLQ